MGTARLFAPLLALAMLALNAHADTFVVNSVADIVDANPGDGVCAAFSGNCTLRAAVMESNSLPGQDRIEVPSGTYVLSAGPLDNTAVGGDLDILDDVTIVGEQMETTIVDGGNLHRPFHVLFNSTLFLETLTVQNGAAHVINGGPLGGGGAVFLQDGSLDLLQCTLRNNRARTAGAILGGTDSSIVVRASNLQNNEAINGGFGAINNIGEGATCLLDKSTVADNLGSTAAVVCRHIDMINSTISGNGDSHNIAAGIWLFEGSVINSTITENHDFGLLAGLLLGPATVKNTIIANNTGQDCFIDALGIVSAGNNLDSDDTCTFTDPTDLPNADPLLGPLQLNFGITPTHNLLAGSPAIGAADDAACPPIDQRGAPRGEDCDIGSVEKIPFGPSCF